MRPQRIGIVAPYRGGGRRGSPPSVSRTLPSDYLVVAQDAYLALRGGGLVLSPLDLDRIRRWRDQGLPLEVVLEGMRRAHRAWHDAGRISRSRPFLLRHAEPHVEELARIHARRAPGGFPTPPAPVDRGGALPPPAPGPQDTLPAAVAWHRQACSRLQALIVSAEGSVRVAYQAALAALESGAELLMADELQARAYLDVLPPGERRWMGQKVREMSGPRAGIPRASYRAMLRANLWEAARTHGQLLRPSDLS